MNRFSVVRTSDGRFRVEGVTGYRLVLDNRFDAERHCMFLNHRELLVEQNVRYYTVLRKISLLAEQIKMGSGEVHIFELAIRIQKLLQEVL